MFHFSVLVILYRVTSCPFLVLLLVRYFRCRSGFFFLPILHSSSPLCLDREFLGKSISALAISWLTWFSFVCFFVRFCSRSMHTFSDPSLLSASMALLKLCILIAGSSSSIQKLSFSVVVNSRLVTGSWSLAVSKCFFFFHPTFAFNCFSASFPTDRILE